MGQIVARAANNCPLVGNFGSRFFESLLPKFDGERLSKTFWTVETRIVRYALWSDLRQMFIFGHHCGTLPNRQHLFLDQYNERNSFLSVIVRQTVGQVYGTDRDFIAIILGLFPMILLIAWNSSQNDGNKATICPMNLTRNLSHDDGTTHDQK